MPIVHLVCGSIGAGKTTYAMALADRVRGVRFSIDDWMTTLFLKDRPPQLSSAWAVERAARCEAQMWIIADQLVLKRVDVIFDVGLSRREHRDRFRLRAAQAGANSKLHFLDVDAQTRRERVRQRNIQRSGTYTFEVTDDMFDYLENAFESPADDELQGAMIVCL
jgi:predicted kinase